MARKARKLAIHYRDLARSCLKEIWDWNANQFGPEHAEKYVKFLVDRADALETAYLQGKMVPNRDSYRYIVVRRKSQGHGHLIVYLILSDRVEVLAFFHTRQDWQGKIDRGDI